MNQKQLDDTWNLLAANAIVWGWQSRRYGAIQALIKDDRLVWSRKAPPEQPPGAWQALQMSPEHLARAMQVLQLA
jgi:hypothetical protein